MRVITWNMRKATKTSAAWETLTKLNPDVALLQEVVSCPKNIEAAFDPEFLPAITKTGKKQKFGTAIFVKGKIIDALPLSSEFDWVNRELDIFSGNIISCTAQPTGHHPINIVSVYSPAWPVDSYRLKDIDVTPVKLKQNSKVWVTEIVWSALKNAKCLRNERWIIGGDFNSSETFDFPRDRGNREFLRRMDNLGLTECLRAYNGKLTPTFKHSSGKVIHQMDHLFATSLLYSSLEKCVTEKESIVFGQSLSDHLPIIAEFKDDGSN